MTTLLVTHVIQHKCIDLVWLNTKIHYSRENSFPPTILTVLVFKSNQRLGTLPYNYNQRGAPQRHARVHVANRVPERERERNKYEGQGPPPPSSLLYTDHSLLPSLAGAQGWRQQLLPPPRSRDGSRRRRSPPMDDAGRASAPAAVTVSATAAPVHPPPSATAASAADTPSPDPSALYGG